MTGNLSVLLVEDNPGDAGLVQEYLSAARVARFHVDHVSTLADALAWLESRPVDVVLLDLGLPDCQGLNSFRQVLTLHPRQTVVVLSGLTDQEHAMQAVKEGAQDYVVKGEVRGELLARVICHAADRNRVQAQVLLNDNRLKSLLAIHQAPPSTEQVLLDRALGEALSLTSSKIGYLYHYSEKDRRFTLNSWSREVMRQCSVQEPQTVYELDKTGIWGEAVRQRKTIRINDFAAFHPLKRGLPDGHVPLKRFLIVPVWSGEEIVAVAGVGNKECDYDLGDELQLSLLMDGVWQVIQRRRAEASVAKTNATLRMVRGVEQLIVRERDAQTLLEETCRLLVTPSGYLAAWASMDGLDGRAALVGSFGRDAWEDAWTHQPGGTLPACVQAARAAKGVVHVSARSASCDNCALRQALPHHDVLGITLRHGGRALGCLAVLVGPDRGLDPEEQTLLEEMSAELAYALHGITQEEAVKRAEAERDAARNQLLQSQKMEAIGRLAGGVAHDFNNLLTVISTGVYFLREAAQNTPEIAEDVQAIRDATESATQLTRQLLAFSRRQVVEKRLVDLNAVVRDMERMLSRLLGETVTIRLDLAESLPNVLMDPGQVEQVLANLCVNGRDAMPRGGTLTIGTRTQVLDGPFCARHPPCQPGEHVALVVTDTGHGMTDDVRSHLFEPFFTTKERGKGTGLGLSTVFGIVFDGRGLVDVDTEVGRGTTVTVYLPVATGVQRTKTGSVGAVAGNPVRGRILVVEDDDNVRNAVVRVLQERGHSLLQARNLEEARTAASLANGLDLLVTDVVMPGGNGREVYAAVLAIQPGIRVLFMSGYTDDEALRTGIMEDDLAFINKPFSPDALAARVRELLSETR